jgi:tripartite-type tricarboxylate transporter receptor subunit TctC
MARLVGVDLPREKRMEIALTYIYGIGRTRSQEILKATGIEVSYVPVSGGVGDIIPQVAGGHIDAAISGFSLLDGDQLRPLALSGTEPHEDFPDVPTFEEAGYPDVELVTSWGLLLPPETPQEIVDTWNAAVQDAMADEGVQEAYAETPFIVLEQDAAAARSYFEEQHEIAQAALEE